MIKMPLDKIIEKIKEKSGASEADINKKIEEKLKQLSGLISKEGAAHIIANEMGIKLVEQSSGRLQIKNILAGMRDVEVVGKIVNIYEVREFQKEDRTGKVGSFVIGDETGSIRVVCWGSQTDIIGNLKENDIVRVKSGYVKENNNAKEVHLGDRAEVEANPEGETAGAVVITKKENKRKKINELSENDSNIELLGTIVQVFDLRFFEVCPECGKRARPQGDVFSCQQHGSVTPAYSYVFNVVLDDGTDSVRCVFFRNQAERLINKTKEEILTYKEKPEAFDDVKTELLGEIIKIVGRVNKNEMFDRLEFVAQLVFPKPDPQEEIDKIKTEQKQTA